MINRLVWDSDFFEIEIGDLIYKNNSITNNSEDFELIYVKNDIDFELEINNFENAFSETKVVFSKNLNFLETSKKNIFSVNKIDYKVEEIYELAYESGQYSRFYLDDNFKKEKFQELYQKWVDNSISKLFADDLFVYQEDNKTIGFITYKLKNDIATIGLIAVSPNYQGKGIGGKLLNYLEDILFQNDIKTLFIPTQENNLAACNFYKKQGYSINEKTIIKHYWKK